MYRVCCDVLVHVGAKVASSDVEDGTCSKFSTYFSALYIEICYRADMNGWRMDARAKTKINYKLALQVDMIRTGGDELALNYPIGPDRYMHVYVRVYDGTA